MSKVWIDLSDISVWQGHHTGTQRVVYEVTKHYEGKPDVGFFVFNPSSNSFHEFELAPIREKIEQARLSPQGEALPPTLSHKVRVKLAQTYNQSPEFVKKHLTEDRRRKIKKVAKATKQLIKPQKQVSIDPDSPVLHFAKGDIVLLLGKPWDYSEFLDTLAKEKKQYQFKIIEVVYDLIPVFFPHLFGLPLFKPYVRHMFDSCAISDGLLAISESTRVDTYKFCEDMLLPKPRVGVVRLGDDFSRIEPSKPGLHDLEKGNFILCVGTVEVRKNHMLLYMAYKEGISRGIDMPKLVIVGGRGWYTEDLLFAFKNDPLVRDNVHIGGRTDEELEWLYENCLFTVYPSVYEGWGLPIAESLARGKVCISSNTSSMTEIAGDLIDYFSPYDSGECLEAILKYMDKEVLANKEKEISRKYKIHTWKDASRQVIDFVDTFKEEE